MLDVAVLFQGHHKGHRDALITTIHNLGGTPVEEKPLAEYARALNAAALKNQNDVLELAARLELGATNTYPGVIPSFKDVALAKVAARLASDETMHWSILSNALGKPLPAGALFFGAWRSRGDGPLPQRLSDPSRPPPPPPPPPPAPPSRTMKLLSQDIGSGTGPFRRASGAFPFPPQDYDYSDGLKKSGIVWDTATLDAWLVGPEKAAPGQKMGYRVPEGKDRADLIAYLRRESGK